MAASQSVLLIGGPDAGKTNFVTRIWLAIDESKGSLRSDGLPDDLEYVQDGAEKLLGGDFVARTSREVHHHIEIPVQASGRAQVRHAKLVVPDCSGEEWMKIYRLREWSAGWEEAISELCGCLLFVRVDSDQNVAALDWITCERLFGTPAILPDISGDESEDFKPPTQVVLTDWLQCLRRAFTSRVGGSFRPRIGIVVAAWDSVPAEQQAAGPEAYLESNYPMLMQFIRTNAKHFNFAVFGVSIVGGDLENAPDFRRDYLNGEQDPADRGYVWHSLDGRLVQAYDLTLPVAWAMALELGHQVPSG